MTNLASIAMGFALFSSQIAFPQLLEMPARAGGIGLTLLQASFILMPSGLAMLAMSPIAGRLQHRWGPKSLLITGSSIIAAGYLIAALSTLQAWHILAIKLLIGIGYAAMPTLIMQAVPSFETAAANGLNTLMRALGTATTSAVIAVVLAGSTSPVGDGEFPSPTTNLLSTKPSAIKSYDSDKSPHSHHPVSPRLVRLRRRPVSARCRGQPRLRLASTSPVLGTIPLFLVIRVIERGLCATGEPLGVPTDRARRVPLSELTSSADRFGGLRDCTSESVLAVNGVFLQILLHFFLVITDLLGHPLAILLVLASHGPVPFSRSSEIRRECRRSSRTPCLQHPRSPRVPNRLVGASDLV